MNDLAEIKQDLIHRLAILKIQYPDCAWLGECLNMNKDGSLIPGMKLVPVASLKYNVFISNN